MPETAPRASGIGPDLVLVSLIVLALHLPFFGSPAIHIDEQFYLTAADKWFHHGLIPFVDVWDRKPIGTFALYILPAALFKNGVLGYQILAAAFVIATAALILHIARVVFTAAVGLPAALIYVVALILMEGAGGQTPIFYNAFVAAAAALYMDALLRPDRNHRFLVCAIGSLCFGLAIQIKYICAFEAATLSLLMLVGLHIRHRWGWGWIGVLAATMIVCGIAPTALAAGYFAAIGHLPEFIDANFISIFEKHLWHLSLLEYLSTFLASSLFCVFFLPFAAYGGIAVFRASRTGAPAWALAFIGLWLASALFGALILGNPTRHYFLSTLVPLSLLTAVGLFRAEEGPSTFARFLQAARRRLGRHGSITILLVVPVIAGFVIAYLNPRERGEARDVFAIANYIQTHTPPGECPFVFNRLPILYYLADVCAPSIYLFPNHLSEIAEVQVPGQARLQELQRVLDSLPPLIYVRRPYTSDIDVEAISRLERALEANYSLEYVRRGHRQIHAVYMRKATHPSP